MRKQLTWIVSAAMGVGAAAFGFVAAALLIQAVQDLGVRGDGALFVTFTAVLRVPRPHFGDETRVGFAKLRDCFFHRRDRQPFTAIAAPTHQSCACHQSDGFFIGVRTNCANGDDSFRFR